MQTQELHFQASHADECSRLSRQRLKIENSIDYLSKRCPWALRKQSTESRYILRVSMLRQIGCAVTRVGHRDEMTSVLLMSRIWDLKCIIDLSSELVREQLVYPAMLRRLDVTSGAVIKVSRLSLKICDRLY